MSQMISVVITTHNLFKQLPVCINELLNQSFSDFNVLIVDDFSTDDTRSVIDYYCEKHPDIFNCIKLEKNLGCPALVRNVALDSGMLNGKYVVFLDGDDNIEPNFLEKLFTTAEKYNADITFCGYDRVNDSDGRVLCREMLGFPECLHVDQCGDTLSFINTSLWNKLIRRELILQFRLPNFSVGEDACFLQELYTKAKLIASVDEILIHYRVRAVSVISNTSQESILSFANELLRIHAACSQKSVRQAIELTIFIHIGISMAIRANDNKNIKTSEHLKWTREYFCANYAMFNDNPLLKLRNLRHHGIKGVAIRICLLLYKCHSFRLFLILYRFVTRVLKIDFKF